MPKRNRSIQTRCKGKQRRRRNQQASNSRQASNKQASNEASNKQVSNEMLNKQEASNKQQASNKASNKQVSNKVSNKVSNEQASKEASNKQASNEVSNEQASNKQQASNKASNKQALNKVLNQQASNKQQALNEASNKQASNGSSPNTKQALPNKQAPKHAFHKHASSSQQQRASKQAPKHALNKQEASSIQEQRRRARERATKSATTKELVPAQTPLSKDTRLKSDEIIPLDEKAFCYYRDGSIWGTGELTRGSAAKKAKNRAVLDLVHLINNPKLNDKQKVQALRKASTHHQCRRIFHSAGLIDDKRYEAMKHFFNQIKKLVVEATATDDIRGRASDKKRAFVDAVLLATASTPSTETNQDESTPSSSSLSAPPSQRLLFNLRLFAKIHLC